MSDFDWRSVDATAQRDGETSLAYQAFLCFLKLGGRRSIAAAARIVEANYSYCHELSHRFEWSKRASEFDESLGAVALSEYAEGVVDAQASLADARRKAASILAMHAEELVNQLVERALNPHYKGSDQCLLRALDMIRVGFDEEHAGGFDDALFPPIDLDNASDEELDAYLEGEARA